MIDTLGRRLKQLREKKHLRQEQIAELIGVDKTTVSCYENDLRQPSYATLIRFSSIFDVTTDYLLGVESPEMVSVEGLTFSDRILVENIIQTLSEKNRCLQTYEQSLRWLGKEYEK